MTGIPAVENVPALRGGLSPTPARSARLPRFITSLFLTSFKHTFFLFLEPLHIGIELAERGLLPDVLIRFIRRLLQDRLRTEQQRRPDIADQSPPWQIPSPSNNKRQISNITGVGAFTARSRANIWNTAQRRRGDQFDQASSGCSNSVVNGRNSAMVKISQIGCGCSRPVYLWRNATQFIIAICSNSQRVHQGSGR